MQLSAAYDFADATVEACNPADCPHIPLTLLERPLPAGLVAFAADASHLAA
jgi:hypothetical protein